MESNQNANPQAPDFLLRSLNKAKAAGQKAHLTGEPIGTVAETICNTLIEAIGVEGYGFAKSEFAAVFLQQAKDAGLMRQVLTEIKVRIETSGSFNDADVIDQVFARLMPLPS